MQQPIEPKEYREKAFLNSPIGANVFATTIIELHWGLKANRPKEFKQIKRILVNSIKNN